MFSEEVIQRFKSKIPKLKNLCDHTIYGITHLDIKCGDGSVRQIVLVFERLRVDEPEKRLVNNQIYADVYIKINDEVLIDIASKQISIDDAIKERLFNVYGDAEIWKLQLEALKKILPNEHFTQRSQIKSSPQEATDEIEKDAEWTDYSSLPQMDLTNVPQEFKFLTDQFEALRNKYAIKSNVTVNGREPKE